MLEQKTAQEKGYITLREAAEISSYAPDYIGQLIRAGKLEGEQVYSSVAWVTTEDAIRAYMAGKSKAALPQASGQTLYEAVENFGVYLLSIIAGGLAITLVIVFYIFAVSIDRTIEARLVESSTIESRPQPVLTAYE